MKEKPKIDSCCWKYLDKAIKKGRATWVCFKCGKDVSFTYYLLQEARMIEQKTYEDVV